MEPISITEILAVLALRVIVIGFLFGSMYAFCARGFTDEYPWPEWSVRMVRRIRGDR